MMDVLRLTVPGLGVVSALMFILWLYQVARKNAGVVDLGWALGLVIMCGSYVLLAPGFLTRKLLIFALVGCWGARLSWLLIGRLRRDSEEDSRYQRIRAGWGDHINLKFFFFFQFQALLDVLLSVPFLIICLNPQPQLSLVEIIGALVFVAAISGETLADQQLSRFRADKTNKGKICQDGLWAYSRHPNYFFEWMTWVAYFIMALGSPYGVLAIVSPLVMLFFLMKVTGIPMIEEHALKTKGEAFREYMRTTSYFVPLPRRAGG